MIDIRKLKELVRLMVANDLTELDLRDSEEQVTIRRPGVQEAPMVQAAPAAAPVAPAPVAAAPAAPAPAAEAPASGGDDLAGLEPIESPMVGTFYSASNPDSPPFVKVGDSVTPETTICLLEAMKIFNEIKPEKSGVVKKVCVNNGESVEFGQPLFYIQPS